MDATIAVTVSVGNVDEAGVVSLESETNPPQAGGRLRAVLLDPDGGVSGETWTWQRSADGTAWDDVAGATGAEYALTNADANQYLRATAAYADAHGSGKTAQAALPAPVSAIITPQPPELTALPQTGNAPQRGMICEPGGARCYVSPDWSLIPRKADNTPKIAPGESFRLMFVTSVSMSAQSSEVGAYNSFVQGKAASNPALKPLQNHFRAMISTPSVSARDNTRTRATDPGASDPLYWVNGDKVADDYADLYDGSWDHNSVNGQWSSDEDGDDITTVWDIWSGSLETGAARTGTEAGTATQFVSFGRVNTSGIELDSGNGYDKRLHKAVYGISPVLTVSEDLAWFATLTVGEFRAFELFGCDNDVELLSDCSGADVLTEDQFTYRGSTYTVEGIWYDRRAYKLNLALAGKTAAETKAALGSLSLNVGGDRFYVADAADETTAVSWRNTALASAWSSGQQVALSLTVDPSRKYTLSCDAAGARCLVPPDWPLIPRNEANKPRHGSGESFRLMFVTSDRTDANAPAIGPYNAFVQRSAGRNLLLKSIKDHFRALASTQGAAAPANTRTRATDPGAGAPIYWVNGVKVGDNYADLYDRSWDYNAPGMADQWPADERGNDITIAAEVWTGTDHDGVPYFPLGDGEPFLYGKPNTEGQELSTLYGHYSSANLPLYGISPVLTVGRSPTLWSATLTVDEDTSGGYFGCDNDDIEQADCSSALTDDNFNWLGVAYTVEALYLDSAENSLELHLSNGAGEGIKSSLGTLTLKVGGTPLAVSHGAEDVSDPTDLFINWDFNPSPAWTDGQEVAVSLTAGGAVACEASGVRCYVDDYWPLTPPGTGGDDSFRLMFITNAQTNAESGPVGPTTPSYRARRTA